MPGCLSLAQLLYRGGEVGCILSDGIAAPSICSAMKAPHVGKIVFPLRVPGEGTAANLPWTICIIKTLTPRNAPLKNRSTVCNAFS